MATDISIEDLRKVMIRPGASEKARNNDRKKARVFLDDPDIKVVEKIDGTKLTLLRRNNEFDPDNYSKNWYIAYRGNIISRGEVSKLATREEEVRSSSSGIAQYSLIHNHLERVHSKTRSIPPGTEFFLEFVQRKPTISRDYPQKHGIFLTLYGTSNYKATGPYLVTNISPEPEQLKLEDYARILEVNTYPVLFRGNFSDLPNLRDGIRSKSIQSRYAKLFPKIEAAYNDKSQDRELKIVDVIYEIFSDFQTALSTDADVSVTGDYPAAEGSVFATSATKALYKALRFDQHDVEHRQSVKQKYRAETPEAEQEYWNGIIAIADKIAGDKVPSQRRNIPEAELDEVLEGVHHVCYFNPKVTHALGSLRHPKSLIQRQEDLFLTTKIRVMKRLEIGTRSGIKIGVFVLAGKPVHDGHWQMVKLASQECDEVLVITSTAGRDELKPGVMTDAWKVVLEPQFHRDFPNATLIITSDSPVNLAVDKMRQLKDVTSEFAFYSDDEDARTKYSPPRLTGLLKDEALVAKVTPRPVPRSETVQISGTKMREFLTDEDRSAFDDHVPRTLSPALKDKYWSILKGEYGPIVDGKINGILGNILEIKRFFYQNNNI